MAKTPKVKPTATASIDPKTARRFVTGMLGSADTELTASSNAVPAQSYKSHHGGKKSNKRNAELESLAVRAFGSCLLDLVWRGRWMFCCGLEPVSPGGETSRPYHGLLRVIAINTRSDASTESTVAELTTHAMERLLERSCNPNLMEMLASEFNYEFVERLLTATVEARSKALPEIKVVTSSGCACVVFDMAGSQHPVIATWYK